MFGKKPVPPLDVLTEAKDLAEYGTAMFDHAVTSLHDANELLNGHVADLGAQQAALKNRIVECANEINRNERVIARIAALTE